MAKNIAGRIVKWSVAAASVAGGLYAAYVGTTWLGYGHPRRRGRRDPVLDLFMPVYDVADRHYIPIDAPAEVVIAAATNMNLDSNSIIRAIFKAREWILHSTPDNVVRPQGLLVQMKSLGWGVLAELPGREIVMGGATKPWEPNPVFRAIPPDQFSTFAEPGYVKIAWTLRAIHVGPNKSVFCTQTRAVATDTEARKRFRLYWSFLSPGIIAIRKVMLPEVKAEAERRWRGSVATSTAKMEILAK